MAVSVTHGQTYDITLIHKKKMRQSNLKSSAKIFQVKIHFQPGHLQRKKLLNSYVILAIANKWSISLTVVSGTQTYILAVQRYVITLWQSPFKATHKKTVSVCLFEIQSNLALRTSRYYGQLFLVSTQSYVHFPQINPINTFNFTLFLHGCSSGVPY